MIVSRVALGLVLFGLIASGHVGHAQEQVFGREVVEPGIQFTFLVAPQDDVAPSTQHLSAEATDLHLEVLAGWTAEASDAVGAPEGGFVPYLHLFARIENEQSGRATTARLVPHVNRSDNFHYARNVTLPGAPDDSYTITFEVHPPEQFELSYHSDWQEAYGTPLFEPQRFTYEGRQVAEIVQATRE